MPKETALQKTDRAPPPWHINPLKRGSPIKPINSTRQSSNLGLRLRQATSCLRNNLAFAAPAEGWLISMCDSHWSQAFDSVPFLTQPTLLKHLTFLSVEASPERIGTNLPSWMLGQQSNFYSLPP